MAIKVSVEKLLESRMSLGELARVESIPISLGFLIAKTVNAVSAELDAFEKARKLALSALCKKDANGEVELEKDAKGRSTGKVVFLDDASEKKFQKDVDELIKTEAELPIDAISTAVLESKLKKDGIEGSIKPEILANCSWLFQ